MDRIPTSDELAQLRCNWEKGDIRLCSDEKTLQLRGERYTSIDVLAKAIINKEEKTPDDIWIAQKVFSLYDKLPEGSRTDREIQKIVLALLQVGKEDFSLWLNSNSKEVYIVEACRDIKAQALYDEIANKGVQNEMVSFTLFNGRNVSVTKEWISSIVRGGYSQLTAVVDNYASFSQNIKNVCPLEELKTAFQILKETDDSEVLQSAVETLSRPFLMDLLEKLGPVRA